jgi:hypothetical protein
MYASCLHDMHSTFPRTYHIPIHTNKRSKVEKRDDKKNTITLEKLLDSGKIIFGPCFLYASLELAFGSPSYDWVNNVHIS